MKNKLISLLLIMCIMFPATMFLTACKKKKNDDPPPPPTALEIFNIANTHLNNILESATVNVLPTAQLTMAITKVYGGEIITFKKDGAKTEILGSESLLGEGNVKMIIDGNGNYYTQSSDLNYTVLATDGEQFKPNIERFSELDTLIKEISDTAHFYQDDPLKLVEQDGARYLSLDLDIGTRLNNVLILNYKNNHDQPIGQFINTMLSDISQKNIDITALVNNFTLTMTEQSTMLDFVNYLSNELGFATDNVIQYLNRWINLINQYLAVNVETSGIDYTGDSDDILSVGYYAKLPTLDITNLSQTNMLQTIRQLAFDNSLTIAEIGPWFAYFVSDPTAITLDDILSEMEDANISQLINYIENTTIQLLGLNVQIPLDENNKPTKILFTILGDGSVKQDSNTYVPLKINATIDCTFSNIGDTTVTLPSTSNSIEYIFDISLPDSKFYWTDTQNKYEFIADSSILPESFDIVVAGVEVAKFTKHNQKLHIDFIAIRELIATNCSAIESQMDNVYRFVDENGEYSIEVKAI